MVVATPKLSDQLCFDLYAASRTVTSAYRRVLRDLGLTYTQYLVMLVLWEDGIRTVRELTETLRLDHGTLTPVLRRMEANGLITRRRATGDERLVEVDVTEAGEALGAHAEQIHCDMKAAIAFTDEQFRELQRTLRLLTANVSESGTQGLD